MSESDLEFRDFVAGSQRRLVHFADLLTADRGHAEDLLQDAYVKAYAAWPRIRSGNPEAYVRRCLINGRTDWGRRRASTERLVAEFAGEDHHAVSGGTEDSDRRLLVLAALNRLTRKERTVLALRYYAGLSEADIAHELGMAPGTVKSTASRAVTKLRADQQLAEGVAR